MIPLTGCSTSAIKEIFTKTVSTYPDLPDIEKPDIYPPHSIKFDFPRKPTGEVDYNSNLYIGLTEEQFKNLTENLASWNQRESLWSNILKLINEQRTTWRANNRSETK